MLKISIWLFKRDLLLKELKQIYVKQKAYLTFAKLTLSKPTVKTVFDTL